MRLKTITSVINKIYYAESVFACSSSTNRSDVRVMRDINNWPIHSSNSSTALCWTLASPSFRNLFHTDGRTPWTSVHSVARPLPTHRTTQTRNKHTHRHPCLEWDSKSWSQLLRERSHFMPYTARPLLSAHENIQLYFWRRVIGLGEINKRLFPLLW
jgi:hypothetical protein